MRQRQCDRCKEKARDDAAEYTWGLVEIPLYGTLDVCSLCSAALLRWVKAGVTDAEVHAGRPT